LVVACLLINSPLRIVSSFSVVAKKPAPTGAVNAFTSWGEAPPAPPSPSKQQQQQQTAVKPPAPPAASKKAPASGKVGVLIGGEHAPEAITAAVAKALALEGVTGAVTISTPDVSTIPFAAKKLAGVVDVVIVATIVMDPQGHIVSSLQAALSQISLSTDVPIIPGIVSQESLLESKAVLGALAPNWARAAASVLSMKNGKLAVEALPEPVIEKAPVLTPQLDDANALMAVLRESLKSHGARGIAGISRKFRIADDDRSGRIDFKEFVKVIGEHSLGWSAKQIRTVFDHFDSDRSGGIDFDEFLFGIRGHLNERRRQLVLMAFEVRQFAVLCACDLCRLSP
jgi:6,7-dimethyl-8-ribityllumazine synthase